MYHIKNDKRSLQSAQWIYEALSSLMAEKNFSEITITETAEKAKLGRATFYRCFDSLEDVLRMKCDKDFEGLNQFLLEYYKSKGGTQRLVFLKPFLRYWYVNSSIIETLIKANRLDIINDSFEKTIKQILAYADKSSEIIFSHSEYFIAIRTGIAINILIQWIKKDMDLAPDALAELIESQMRESRDFNLLL